MMDDIFGDMISECIIIVYMDDIFLFAADKATLTEKHKTSIATTTRQQPISQTDQM